MAATAELQGGVPAAPPPAACYGHGRECLVNAGAPNVVRCAVCSAIYERCSRCRGQHVRLAGETPVHCPDCTDTPHPGWQVRKGKWGSPYPVS